MKILLHCCCAPCSISSVSCLRSKELLPVLFWYNPYIYPYDEYVQRRNCLKEFASNEKLDISIKDEHDYSAFNSLEKEKQCEKCYTLRIEKTASKAALEEFTYFTTSLLISPYQNHEKIRQICEEAAVKYSVGFFYMDFRPYFKESQTAARNKGFYMQKYCGCVVSRKERFSKL